jgi:hypothetical protein
MDLYITENKRTAVLAIPSYLTSCGHERSAPRRTYGTFAFSDINTSPILGKPLSRENLKLLLDAILLAIAQMPDDNFKCDYEL